MHPILFEFHGFELPTYGVLLLIGVVLGAFTASRRAGIIGLPGDKILDLALWVVLWGLAGAKALLVVTDPSYLTSPYGWWSLLRAGGVFYGGLIGALVAAIVLLRRYKLPFFPVADTLAPSIALGHFFGRLGCFSAGCCYGAACNLPWAVTFTNPRAAEVSGTPLGVPLQPTQLYEAFFNLANYVFLAWLFRKRLAPGSIIGTYLITYGVARFAIEFVRGDADRGFVLGGALSTSQAIAAVMVPVGIAILVWARRTQGTGDAGQGTAKDKR